MPDGPPRAVYVLHTAPDGRAPADVVAAWPNATRLLAALNATGRVEASAVWRTDHADTDLTVDGVVHRFVRDGRIGARVAAAARRQRPHAVHVNSFLYPAPTLALRAALGHRPTLLVQHHGEPPPPQGGRAARLGRLAAVAVDAVAFTGADEWAPRFARVGLVRPRQRVYEVLEAAAAVSPLDRDEARRRTGVHGDPAVVWVGRLIDSKDPLTAVDAFADALTHRLGAHLWMLCTNRTGEDAVRRRIAERGVTGRVTLLGPVPHDDVAAVLSAADLFFATSLREGSGYALIEAVTCGATPVVTDLGPHRAIAGAQGERFAAGDRAGAAAALARAIVRPVAEVRADAAERLTWARIAEQLLVAYGLGASTVQ